MAYQFTQTGAEIQDILNQVGDNTSDISALDTRLTTAEGEIDTAQGDISALNLSLEKLGGANIRFGTIANNSTQNIPYTSGAIIFIFRGSYSSTPSIVTCDYWGATPTINQKTTHSVTVAGSTGAWTATISNTSGSYAQYIAFYL